ncbi:hypothetical protein MCERE10_03653 [Burkholderiaceae bacterium]
MIDDADDKVRRNLILFCSFFIISYWLDISSAELIHKLTGLNINLSANKRATLLLVILSYLSLRYKFSKAFTEGFNQLKIDWLFKVKSVATKIVKLQFSRGSNSTSDIFHPSLDKFCSNFLANQIGAWNEEYDKAKMTLVGSLDFTYEWGGQVTVQVDVYQKKNGNKSIGQNALIEFSFKGLNKYWLLCRSVVSLIYSKSAVDLLVPILLALVSLPLICLGYF